MGKKFKAVVRDICNMINSMLNEQELKYFVKKGGSWRVADDLDLLFFNKEEFTDVMPRKRGDLLQTNSWQGFILAVFIGNRNCNDTNYIMNQLSDAEKMAPKWLCENSDQA